jgi:hypothetical protein
LPSSLMAAPCGARARRSCSRHVGPPRPSVALLWRKLLPSSLMAAPCGARARRSCSRHVASPRPSLALLSITAALTKRPPATTPWGGTREAFPSPAAEAAAPVPPDRRLNAVALGLHHGGQSGQIQKTS